MSDDPRGEKRGAPTVTFGSYVIPKREAPKAPPPQIHQAKPVQPPEPPQVRDPEPDPYLPEPQMYQAEFVSPPQPEPATHTEPKQRRYEAEPKSAPQPSSEPLPFAEATPEPTAARAVVVQGFQITPMMIAASVVGVLTFMLGVVTTLLIMSFAPAPQASFTALPESDTDLAQMLETAANEPAPLLDLTPSAALEVAVEASLQTDVTRSGPADLISPVGALSYPTSDAISMTEILLGLQPTASALANDAVLDKAVLNRDKLTMLRDYVLAGDYTVKSVERHGKERLCLQIPQGNVTPDEAADLIRAAAERGEIELPEALSTADGTFDADTLIFNLVQTSLATDGTERGAEAAREMSRRAFAASNAKTRKVEGERVYIVEPGDSLAYLSLQFYGQPSSYDRIFQANRNILSSPDKIQIGQRLIIPG